MPHSCIKYIQITAKHRKKIFTVTGHVDFNSIYKIRGMPTDGMCDNTGITMEFPIFAFKKLF